MKKFIRFVCIALALSLLMAIPAYANGRDVAILFARFVCSEDALRVIRNQGYKINCYECENYDFEQETAYMKSVMANMDIGEGKYISMDNLSKICGLLDCQPADLIAYEKGEGVSGKAD